MVLLLDIKLQHEDLSMLTEKYPVKLYVLNSIPLSDYKRALVLASSYDKSSLESFIKVMKEDKAHVKHVKVISRDYNKNNGYSAYLETISPLRGSITEVMLKHNVYEFKEVIMNGLEHWIVLTNSVDGRLILDDLEDKAIIISARRIKADEVLKMMSGSILTNDELKILKIAYSMGYFDEPRHSTTKDIAAVLGVSKSTFIKNIRRILKKLIMRELCYEYFYNY